MIKLEAIQNDPGCFSYSIMSIRAAQPSQSPILKERELWDFERGFQTEGIQNLLPVCPVNVGKDHSPFPIFGDRISRV